MRIRDHARKENRNCAIIKSYYVPVVVVHCLAVPIALRCAHVAAAAPMESVGGGA